MTWHPVTGALPRRRGGPAGLAYPSGSDCFAVEELPLYEACGEGEHLYLTIEKRDIDTPELLRRLGAALGLPPREIGWAGLKDARAMARQRVSVPRRAAEGRLPVLGDESYRVLDARAHRNKLRAGHLAGNRFRLLLRGETDPDAFAADLALLARGGLPNYFGFQRFGRGADNHHEGERLLRRGSRGRGRRERFLISAYQASLFNRVVVERLGALGTLLTGDLAWIHGKGAVFAVEDATREAARAARLEISHSGPLPGRRMSCPTGEAGELEERLLAEAGWQESFATLLTGGRRPLRVPVDGVRWEGEAGALRLEFTLPPGSYASVLLAELGVHPGTGPGAVRGGGSAAG